MPHFCPVGPHHSSPAAPWNHLGALKWSGGGTQLVVFLKGIPDRSGIDFGLRTAVEMCANGPLALHRYVPSGHIGVSHIWLCTGQEGLGGGGKSAFKLPVTKRHQDGFNQNPQGVWGWRGWGQFLGKSFLGDQVTRVRPWMVVLCTQVCELLGSSHNPPATRGKTAFLPASSNEDLVHLPD